VAEILIDNGAEVNAVDECGSTPLHWAAGDGRRDVAELLIQRGACPPEAIGREVSPPGLEWRGMMAWRGPFDGITCGQL